MHRDVRPRNHLHAWVLPAVRDEAAEHVRRVVRVLYEVRRGEKRALLVVPHALQRGRRHNELRLAGRNRLRDKLVDELRALLRGQHLNEPDERAARCVNLVREGGAARGRLAVAEEEEALEGRAPVYAEYGAR